MLGLCPSRVNQSLPLLSLPSSKLCRSKNGPPFIRSDGCARSRSRSSIFEQADATRTLTTPREHVSGVYFGPARSPNPSDSANPRRRR